MFRGASGSAGGDPIEGNLPLPSLRSARPTSAGSSPLAMPRPSAAAMALTGAGPAGSLAADMMALETLIRRISQKIPALSAIADPFIQQMRDLGAAAISDQSQGGIGAANLGAAAPPAGAMGPAGPGAGPAGPPGLMPPPPMMQ